MIEFLFPVELLITLILFFTEVEAGDVAAEVLGEVAGTPAISGSQVQYSLENIQVERGGHFRDDPFAGHIDGFFFVVVDTDMDVFASPDLEVKFIGVGTVVILLCTFHRACFISFYRHLYPPY